MTNIFLDPKRRKFLSPNNIFMFESGIWDSRFLFEFRADVEKFMIHEVRKNGDVVDQVIKEKVFNMVNQKFLQEFERSVLLWACQEMMTVEERKKLKNLRKIVKRYFGIFTFGCFEFSFYR